MERKVCAWGAAALTAVALWAALAGMAPRRTLARDGDPNAECLRCHADEAKMREGGDALPAYGLIRPEALARSEHRGMACLDCHTKALLAVPHPEPLTGRRATCQDCHGNDTRGPGKVDFRGVVRDFDASVHVERAPDFRCVRCHDPHTIQLATTRERVFEHNRVCLRCHDSDEEFGAIAPGKKRVDVARSHEWLPNRAAHWAHARCIDCHTSYEPPIGSHLILPKQKAVKACDACHSASSILRLKLYKHRRSLESNRLGFANAAIVNDSYVVGATRSIVVDGAGAVVAVVTLLGVLGHGLLRVRARRLRRSDEAASNPEAPS